MKERITITPTLFYDIVSQALSERNMIPEGMSLKSIEELYALWEVNLDFADAKDW